MQVPYTRQRLLVLPLLAAILVFTVRTAPSSLPPAEPQDIGTAADVRSEPPGLEESGILAALERLQAELQDLLGSQRGTYGIYVMDVLTGRGRGINSDLLFPAASTFKLPMAMYILEEAAAGRASLQDRLAYSYADWEDGTGWLQGLLQEGDTLTVAELIEHAIRYSDNIATNMLLRRFGRSNVFAYMEVLGGAPQWFDPQTIGTTPHDMALYMQWLQTPGTLGDEEHRVWLSDLLADTVFHDRARAGVPETIRVEHKIGTLAGVVNDVATVQAERPFVVAAFSYDVDEETAASVIAEVTSRALMAIGSESPAQSM